MAPVDMAPQPSGINQDAVKAILARLFLPGVGQPPSAANAPAPAGMTQPSAQPKAPGNQPGPTAGGMPAAKPQAKPTSQGAPPNDGNGPSVLTEEQFNEQNSAPPHVPYKVPGVRQRLLAGLFSGLTSIRDPRGGEEQLNSYLSNIQKNEDEEKAYPQQAADQAHARYMQYLEGVKGPLDIATAQQTLANRRTEAQRLADGQTLQQSYAQAVRSGDKETAKTLLAAIRDLTGAEAKPGREVLPTPYSDWRAQNPNAPVSDWIKLNTQAKKELKSTPSGGGHPSAAAMAYMDWKKQNPHGKVEDWYAMQSEAKAAPTPKEIDALQKERDTVANQYNRQINSIETDPANVAKIEQERDARLKVYDRIIHNMQNGYKVGGTIDTPQGPRKIIAINPDGMIQAGPE